MFFCIIQKYILYLTSFTASKFSRYALLLLLLLLLSSSSSSVALQTSAGYGLLVSQGFLITHEAPLSVGLLWTSDQRVPETST
jgi:hypothetical protein